MSQPVNAQITDAVTPIVPADPESLSAIVAALYQAAAQSLGIAYQNAVQAQQSLNTTSQASTTMGVNLLYTLDTASTGVATAPVDARVLEDPLKQLHAVSSLAQAARPAAEAETEAAPGDADREIDAAYHHAVAHMRAVTEAVAASLDRLNAVSVRQSIRVVAQAAVTVALSRALAVDAASPNAAEQVALYTNLAQTIVRDLEAWARSV